MKPKIFRTQKCQGRGIYRFKGLLPFNVIYHFGWYGDGKRRAIKFANERQESILFAEKLGEL